MPNPHFDISIVKRKKKGSSQIWVYKTTRQGQKPDVREKETEVTKTIGVTFSNLDLIIEALKLTCVDGERCMGDETVQATEFMPPEFGERGNIAVYSSIKPF